MPVARRRQKEEESLPLLPALIAGGDSRLALDARTGLNKYLCPPTPARDIVSVSSCTASPIAADGFERVRACLRVIEAAESAVARLRLLTEWRSQVEAGLLGYFGAGELAHAMLCPSGTDAVLLAATMVAAEWPGGSNTAILPVASETGTGVPLAAACRTFDVQPGDAPDPSDCAISTIEVPLRSADGEPRSDDVVNIAYAAAAASARGRPIVYLTHSTKTGLLAPVEPPPDIDVIVDACQARIDPSMVVSYLRRGWPVVVTGSKFFGGPAFSGAVLFPRNRLSAGSLRIMRATTQRTETNLGMLLRWIAALDVIEAFGARADCIAPVLRDHADAIDSGLGAIPNVVPLGGMPRCGTNWAGSPSIFTFAVREARHSGRLLTAAELRPIYQDLARHGVLVGQPVGLGSFGGLRIAVGARDLLEPDSFRWDDLFGTLREVVAKAAAGQGRDGQLVYS